MKVFKRIMALAVVLVGVGAAASFVLHKQQNASAEEFAPADLQVLQAEPPVQPTPPPPINLRVQGLKDRGDGALLLWPAAPGETLKAAGFADNDTLIVSSTSSDPTNTYRIFAIDLISKQQPYLLQGSTPRFASSYRPAHENADRFCYAQRGDTGTFDIWCADYGWKNPQQLTRHNGNEDLIDPAISPDGSWVSFEVNTDRARLKNPKTSASTVWKIGLNGAGLQQLTRGADDRRPTWSHDGGQLYFQRRLLDGNWDLYSMNADGSNPEPIMRTIDDDEQWPARIDGTDQMAIVVGPKGGTTRVKLLNTMTKASHALTSGQYGLETAVSVSPDGKLVSFLAPIDPANPTRLGVWLKEIE